MGVSKGIVSNSPSQFIGGQVSQILSRPQVVSKPFDFAPLHSGQVERGLATDYVL